MIKIVLDTNFCLIPFQFNVDIFSEFERIIDEKYKIIVPTACMEELGKQKFGGAAITLLQTKNVLIIDAPPAKNVDERVLQLAIKENAVLATQDKELKNKAKKAGLFVVTLRQKKHLVLK